MRYNKNKYRSCRSLDFFYPCRCADYHLSYIIIGQTGGCFAMALITCRLCRKIFTAVGGRTCPDCKKRLDELYKKVRDFLRDNSKLKFNRRGPHGDPGRHPDRGAGERRLLPAARGAHGAAAGHRLRGGVPLRPHRGPDPQRARPLPGARADARLERRGDQLPNALRM